jgi:RNA recognition motif-containing protein
MFDQFSFYYLYLRFPIRFAFVTFENESDCAAALKAHTQIGGAKVDVSYAFAKVEKPTTTDSNKNQEKKPTPPTEKTNKKQPPKPGLCRTSTFSLFYFVFFFSRKANCE